MIKKTLMSAQKAKKFAIYSVIAVGVLVVFAAMTNFQSLRGGAIANLLPQGVRHGIKDMFFFIHDAPSLAKASLSKEKIDRVEITMDPEDLRAIYQIDTDQKYLDQGKQRRPVKVSFKGKEYNAEVRLRGETSPHWAYEKKSWRIELDKKKIFDVSTLEFIVASDRFYVVEQFNNARARKMGLLVPDSQYANLTINNKDFGVYFVSERIADDFVTRHELPEETVIYGETDLNRTIYENAGLWKINAGEESEVGFGPLITLIDAMDIEDDEKFYKRLKELVNIEKFALWNAHQILAGSEHQDWAHNTRIMYRPDTNLMYFIPWDVEFQPLHRARPIDRRYNPIINRLINIPEYQIMRAQILWSMVGNDEWVRMDKEMFDEIAGEVTPAAYRDRTKEHTNKEVKEMIAYYDGVRQQNINYLQEALQQNRALAHLTWKTNQRKTEGKMRISIDDESPAALARIVFPPEDARHDWKLYKDNGDGIHNRFDQLLGISQNGVIEIKKEIPLHAIKYDVWLHNRYEQFETKLGHYDFFLVRSGSQFNTDVTPRITVQNLVTRENQIIEPAIGI